LQPELDDFVVGLMRTGDFANYSEVIRHALRELRRLERDRLVRLESNPAFSRSLDSAEAGNTRDFDLRTIGE
jgi:Arc/MetJ-type ribon-helix-helix transcriptional regulator